MMADSPMLAMALPSWEEAMASCFHFEMKVRLLAGVFFPAESVTRDIGDKTNGKQKVDGLLILVFQKFAFTSEEKAFLTKCNTFRNKLIHCEPDAVRRLVQELDPTFLPPFIVEQIALPQGATGKDVLEIITTRKGAVPVPETSSRSDGFAGWMIQ